MGNIHPKVTEALLAEVFTAIGPLAGCKLIRKEKVYLVWKSLYLKLAGYNLFSATRCYTFPNIAIESLFVFPKLL